MTTTDTESEFEKRRMIHLFAERIATAAGCAAGDMVELQRRCPETALEEIAKHLPSDVAEVVKGNRDTLEFLIDTLRLVFDRGTADSAKLQGMVDRMADLGHTHPGSPLDDMARNAASFFKEKLRDRVERSDDTGNSSTMVEIRRLFAENPSPLGEGQAPAIQCAVVLYGFPTPIQGVLSETEHGGLRLLAPADPSVRPVGGTVNMVEHFFSYDVVTMIAVQRQITLQTPKIIVRD